MAQEDLKNKLKELQQKCDEYLAGWKRERADFLNYKKDEADRINSLVKYANEEILLSILPILDNICLAEKHAPLDSEWTQGFILIKKQLEEFLAKEGIEPIDVLGKEFDPSTMEAVEGEGENVAEEVQRGYTMHGKLLRPAKVKISK